MKRFLFFAAILAFSVNASAQLQDDFSDGDLTANPAWLGQSDKFVVTAGELQLSDPSPGANNNTFLYLSAPTSLADTTVWTFYARLAFSPSSSNLGRVYLAVSEPPGAASFTGYYLQLGGISGNADALELYRQDGAQRSLLLSGTAGALGGAEALVRARVTRYPDGRWTLEADYTGGDNWQPEGSANDATYTFGQYMGIGCTYTATRASAFFFDDFGVDPLFVDQEAPTSIAAEALSPLLLRLTANEPLDPATAAQPNRYAIDGGIGQPIQATPVADNPAAVDLSLAAGLTNLQTYRLTATGLADAAGNAAGALTADFTYVDVTEPAPADVLITEIMADPSPPLGLPNAEYIELYNASAKVLNLADLFLSTGGAPQRLPDQLLLPGAYVIVTALASAPDFATQGDVAALVSFPTLTNTGDEVVLSTAASTTICQVNYTDDWYADFSRAEGGYSLELIDRAAPYDCPGNWRASLAAAGGTPGKLNSVDGMPTDTAAPLLLRVFPAGPQELVLRFDDLLDAAATEDISAYVLTPAIAISEAILEADRSSLRLYLAEPLAPGQSYTLAVRAGLADCLGNASPAYLRRVGLPQAAAPGDIVINELLFNPFTGGSDFVELLNVSDKIIDLRELRLANRAPDGSSDIEEIETNYLLFPGEYAALSANPNDIRQRYFTPVPEALLENELPSLPDDAGNLSLINAAFVAIDSVDYTEDWHSALLRDRNGISLERIRPGGPSQSPANWHSASGAAGYATPTGPNSQLRDAPVPANDADKLFRITESVFSPDGDGYRDVLLIEYDQPEPGYAANIVIFDAQGREVISLGRRELLAGAGAFLWEGATADGQKARIGIYVVQIEYYHPNGDTRRETHTCVLAGQLD